MYLVRLNMGAKLTEKEFIDRAKQIHGDKYDYSELEFTKISGKGKIICKEHGPFYQVLVDHTFSAHGCPVCAGSKKHTVESFSEKGKKIHGDKYDYSKVEYKNNKIAVTLICKTCEAEFKIRPDAHINGKGCSKCGYIKAAKSRQITKEKYVNQCKIYHGDKYEYDKLIYDGMSKKGIITCKIHGDFKQSLANHISGAGCPKCKTSKGEDTIHKFLNNNNIKYEIEKVFDDCRNPITNNLLFFDFYLPKYNLIIEYDGMQHYVINDFYGGEEKYIEQKYRDYIKSKYCIQKGISLHRIIYLDDKHIEFILNTILNE